MKLYLKTKDYSVSGEDFELVHDEGLDMLVTQPQPENLDKYYQSSDYISHTDSKRTLVDKIYHVVKKYSLWRKQVLIDKYANAINTLLDVGAGTGDFLLTAKNKGWFVEGVEPNSDAKKRAYKKGVELFDSLDAVSDRKFEVITLWHVLEHLPKLEIQIEKLISLLEEEGTLIIAVPNFRSYDALYYKNFWAAYDVPRHLWHFSRKSIQKLFANRGMKVVAIKPMLFDAFYVSLLSGKYKYGKQQFLNAFWIGLTSNVKAWRSKEYSSLIYIIKKS